MLGIYIQQVEKDNKFYERKTGIIRISNVFLIKVGEFIYTTHFSLNPKVTLNPKVNRL